jgi:hypothetical protein
MSSVRTPTGVLSFPQLFQAKAQVQGGDPRFSINLILDKTAQATPEYQQLRKIVAATIDEKWGVGKSQDKEWIKRMKLRLPFRPTADRDYTGYDIEGGVFISPWSKNKPGLVGPDLQDITVPGDIWSGQLARCTVHAFAYETQGNRGVSFNLNNVQITKLDMPRLDGRKPAKDEFDNVGADPEAGDGDPFSGDEPPF